MNKEMKLEEYLSEKELLSNQKKEITRLESVLRNYFIECNKPCEIESTVEITRHSGRKTKGKVKGFSILSDGLVYVDSIKPEKGATVYISTPYLTLKKL